MEKRKLYLFVLIVIATLAGSLSSCKKEYLKTPFNQIEAFSVTDSLGNQLKASLTGDSIIVYWPPYQTAPVKVTPQIVVSSGASISPASGTQVTFASGTVYTVTAQDGSKKTYKLIPLINQPAPVFDVANNTSLQIGDYLGLRGQYFIPDTTKTRLYLINVSNKDIPVSLKEISSFNTFGFVVRLPQDNSIDTGYYKVKLVNGTNTSIKGPYHFGLPAFPAIQTADEGKNVKSGQAITFTFSGPFAKYFYHTLDDGQASFYIGDNWDYAGAAIKNLGNGTFTITIPAGAPLGVINGIDLADKDGNGVGGWFPISPNITIVE